MCPFTEYGALDVKRKILGRHENQLFIAVVKSHRVFHFIVQHIRIWYRIFIVNDKIIVVQASELSGFTENVYCE